MVLEKTLESPLDSKEIKPVNPKGNQPWIFIGMTDVEGEAPLLWPPDEKSQLIGKDPDAGKDWGQEEKGATEDEMVGWHHWLSGYEFEQTRRYWRTGKPGMLQSTGLQRVRHDWGNNKNDFYVLHLIKWLTWLKWIVSTYVWCFVEKITVIQKLLNKKLDRKTEAWFWCVIKHNSKDRTSSKKSFKWPQYNFIQLYFFLNLQLNMYVCDSHSVMSDSLWLHGL